MKNILIYGIGRMGSIHLKYVKSLGVKYSWYDPFKKDSIEEVIIATSATVEGQTTAHYIKDSLKDTKAKVSKLAQGLPVGGEIESLDDGTLFSAFKNRKWIEKNSD